VVPRASMVQELYIEQEATREEAVAVTEAFARAGFPVTVKRGLEGPPEEWGVVFSATGEASSRVPKRPKWSLLGVVARAKRPRRRRVDYGDTR
jgi:hypothetical protein